MDKINIKPKRTCKECGMDISHKKINALFCSTDCCKKEWVNRVENKERLKKYQREYQRYYRIKNKEKIKAYLKEYVKLWIK